MMDADGPKRCFHEARRGGAAEDYPSQAYAIIRQLQKDGKIELVYGGKYSKYRVVKQ